ncbi:uncharacterized protein UDID_17293 [Ustilago sp. UG-2017a]|nr:uncharacterized protein UDID_17293 [Ustilago sp. UG-2017a]
MTDWATWTTVWTSVWTIARVPERMRNSQIFERLGVRLESTFLDRFFSMVTIFLAIHVVTMFVFLGFMWLLSGMTGLLWGYQEGRLPTLEEVLPNVREATPARIFGHQPQLTDSLDNHLSALAQALTGDAPRLPVTNLTSADLHSPLSIFLPPFPESPSAQQEN